MALLLNANNSVNRSYTITKPSPNHPLDVNGVGVRTENLCNGVNEHYWIASSSNTVGRLSGNSGLAIPVKANTYYTVSTLETQTRYRVCIVDELPEYNESVTALVKVQKDNTSNDLSIYSRTGKYLILNATDLTKCVINTGSTAKPYEPYGYKIPISNGQQTTNIYLGSTQTTRWIKKMTFTGDENWRVSPNWKKTNTSVFYYEQPDMERTMNTTKIYVMSDKFEATSRDGLYDGDTDMIAKTGSFSMTIRVSDSIATTVQEFKAWLASNPVTVWYVLATPETATVNEPLMKIGDYADTLSNAAQIPTIEGANSITVDTTVQPSEFTATWTGWHDASVKEWDGSGWQ